MFDDCFLTNGIGIPNSFLIPKPTLKKELLVFSFLFALKL